MNLVVNARDAMPDGGTLAIETAEAYLDDSYAEVHADVEPGRYVMLSVSDTGTGMDRETRERVFEPFFTTKGEEEGTGLGLATVYGIASQSGGHIYVYSEPGEGSVFKVYLPRTDCPEPSVRTGGEISEEELSGRETVLLVEDEDIVRELIGSVLRRHGHTVLTATCGKHALEVAAEWDDQIDILVTDVIMPGMTGAELADAMHEHHPDLPVLFVSGYTDNSVIQQGVVDDSA
jgi:CheY-like chemotaxis protein